MGSGHIALLGDNRNAAAARVVADDLIVVVPENIRRRLRAVLDGAGQVDGAALVDVQIRTTDNGRCGNWNGKRKEKNKCEISILAQIRFLWVEE